MEWSFCYVDGNCWATWFWLYGANLIAPVLAVVATYFATIGQIKRDKMKEARARQEKYEQIFTLAMGGLVGAKVHVDGTRERIGAPGITGNVTQHAAEGVGEARRQVQQLALKDLPDASMTSFILGAAEKLRAVEKYLTLAGRGVFPGNADEALGFYSKELGDMIDALGKFLDEYKSNPDSKI